MPGPEVRRNFTNMLMTAALFYPVGKLKAESNDGLLRGSLLQSSAGMIHVKDWKTYFNAHFEVSR